MYRCIKICNQGQISCVLAVEIELVRIQDSDVQDIKMRENGTSVSGRGPCFEKLHHEHTTVKPVCTKKTD